MFLIFTLGCGQFIFAQRDLQVKNFNQQEFDKFEINRDIFNFWWYKNKNILFNKNDTLPYIVDDRNYRGVVNYGVEYSRVDRRNLNFTENFIMYYQKIKINSCRYSIKDSIIEIEGEVSGGVPQNDNIYGKDNNINVFIGKIVDTTKILYLNILDPDIYITKFKGEIINKLTPLDTFNGYYIDDYVQTKTKILEDDKRRFTIKSKVKKNSTLIFASNSTFTRVYEVGKMIYSNNSGNLAESVKNSEIVRPLFKVIIRDNVQIADPNAVEKSEYYLKTEEAENYILNRQYGHAAKIYMGIWNKFQHLFARDIHNAVRCAIFARDYSRAIFWCERLVLKGVPLNYFDAKIFDRIRKGQLWQSFVSRYADLHEQFKVNFDEDLKLELEQLVEADQVAYKKNIHGNISRGELHKVTDSIDNKLVELITKKGFPSEERIGVEISKNGVGISDPKFYVLVYHSHQTKGDNFDEFREILKSATEKFLYDGYRDNLSLFKKNGNTCLQIYKGKLYNDKTCNLNKLQVEKIKFRFNNEFGFKIDSGEMMVYPYNPKTEKEDDEYFSDKFDFVLNLTDDWLFYEN